MQESKVNEKKKRKKNNINNEAKLNEHLPQAKNYGEFEPNKKSTQFSFEPNTSISQSFSILFRFPFIA